MADTPQPNTPNAGRPLTPAEARLYDQVKDSLRDINIATNEGRDKFRELVSATAEWDRSLKQINEDLDNIDDNFGLIRKNVQEIGSDLAKELNKELENAGDNTNLVRARIGDIKKLFNETNQSVRRAADLTQDFYDGTARTADVGKQITKNQKTITQLTQEAVAARDRGNGSLAIQLENLIQQQEVSQSTLKTLEGQSKQLDKASGLTGKLLDGFKKIPLIGEALGHDLAHINDELREEGAEALKNNTRFNMMGAAVGKMKGLITKTLKDPLVLTGIAIAGIIKAFNFLKETAFGFSKNVAETGKQMGLTRDSAIAMVEYTQYVSDHAHDIGTNMKTAGEAMRELNDAFGTSTVFSAELIEGQVELKERMGLTADEASNISKFALLTGKTQDDIVFGVTKQNKGILNNKKVLQEVAKTEGQLAAFYKNDPILIGKAVIQAQKLGLTLEKTKQMTDSLLDIESSLTNEYEAEALIGKDINLNQARQLAMMGDTAGAAKAMLDNIGGINEFQNLNHIQQDALAKSMGMSSDELAKTLTQQAQLSKLSSDQVERVKQLRAEGKNELADKIEAAAGDEKAVRMAEMQVDAHERLSQAGEKFREAITRLVQGPLGTMIDGFANVAGSLATGVGYISKFASFLGDIPVLGEGLKKLGTVAAVILGFKGLSGLFKFMMKGTTINPMVVTLSPQDKLAAGGGNAASNLAGAAPGGAGKGRFGKLTGRMGRMLGGVGTMLGLGGLASTAAEAAPAASSAAGGAGAAAAPAATNLASAATPSPAPSAAGGGGKGGGIFGKIGGFFSKVGEKASGLLNPVKSIGKWMSTNIGPFMKKLAKFPIINGLLEGVFAYGDIKEMIASGDKGSKLNQAVGKRVMQGLGAVLGGIGGAALGSLIPIPGVGTFLGGLAGDYVGRLIGGAIADFVGAETIGSAVVGMMGDDGRVKMAEGGIVTGPTKALVGEAGNEAVVPLKEFYAKIDELIIAVKQGGNIYLDGTVVSTKLQSPMAIATRRTG